MDRYTEPQLYHSYSRLVEMGLLRPLMRGRKTKGHVGTFGGNVDYNTTPIGMFS